MTEFPTVRVAAVQATPVGTVATQIRASYRSVARRNLTPCVIAPAQERVHYTGTLS